MVILQRCPIADFAADNNNRALFKIKTKIAGRIGMMLKKMLKLEYH